MTTDQTLRIPEGGFKTFADFYPYYLSEHGHPTNRRLHVVGTGLALLTAIAVVASRNWALLWLPLIAGYGFAWVGHFFFEHNRPATFKHPLYSLRGDFVMLKDVLTGRIDW